MRGVSKNIEIANTIIEQIGGKGFAIMTGAKNFIAVENGVRFNIGKNSTRCNLVEITLNGSDLYDMKFFHKPKITAKDLAKYKSYEEFKTAMEPKLLKGYDDVYADMMAATFREYTGLETRFPAIRFN